MKSEGIGKQVGNIVYAPTMVAYCWFSTIDTAYYMLIPIFIYLVLTIFAWHALADVFDK